MTLDRKPRVGDHIAWPSGEPYVVIEVRDNGIARIRSTGGNESSFIYRFNDGWNRLARFVKP